MANMTAMEIVEMLDLEPHPEGGYFRESYRSGLKIPGGVLAGGQERDCSTAIYYLLDRGACSRLHRIASDEIWHFYLGDPLVVAEIAPSGEVSETRLGTDLKGGEMFQHVVPAGSWFGAYLPDGSDYALVGCTVAPGFDFADFEMGETADLLKLYPHARSVIEILT